MPLSITSAPRQLSDGNTAGTVLGQATHSDGTPETLGFFGATPVPQMLQGSLFNNFGLLTVQAITATATPIGVGANTTTEIIFSSLTGIGSTDMVIAAIKPTTNAGYAIGTARVSAANTIRLTVGNDTAATVTPTASENYVFATVSTGLQTVSISVTPAAVTASSVSEQTFTVTGVQPGMIVAVNKPTVQAGLMISQARAVAANTVGVTFVNVTGSTITPTAGESYLFFAAQGMRVQPVMYEITQILTPVSIAANTSAEQTFTVPGLVSGTAVMVNKPSVTGGVALTGFRVSAANTLALNYTNSTSAAITPPSETYTIAVFPQAYPTTSGGFNTQLAALGVESGRELGRLGITG